VKDVDDVESRNKFAGCKTVRLAVTIIWLVPTASELRAISSRMMPTALHKNQTILIDTFLNLLAQESAAETYGSELKSAERT
jgi:hypothetical protein